jgi:hypothetical protein
VFHQLVAARVDKRKRRWALNIIAANGWMTSVSGDPDMRLKPSRLTAAG